MSPVKYLLEYAVKKAEMTPDRIKAIRKSFNLTQVAFSNFIMVGYETYRSWEEGRRFPSSPGYAVLVIAEQSPEAFIKNRKDVIKDLKKYGL
ncbi:XRE-type DNA-binding domain protein (plasmid) [Candidatus Trichorickettsia mobilis]|uniref:helix-turn-helix domain-containing protein n=1 Tax=Candidatus Trichorickettsia mobilis TaxID=1346319 RepID=UPI002B259862|nr:hypothetical protein [Candidatus Trichorickettsia mobilis]WPY01892.1 XRE-type DNA-binding domain protein [Candidatus Trichorickettsia mobilis]